MIINIYYVYKLVFIVYSMVYMNYEIILVCMVYNCKYGYMRYFNFG